MLSSAILILQMMKPHRCILHNTCSMAAQGGEGRKRCGRGADANLGSAGVGSTIST